MRFPPRSVDRLGALALVGGVFFAALDQTGVVTAIPAMVTEFEIPFDALDQTAWIITGFLLGYTVVMPLAGRLSDLAARERIYVGALGVFVAGSIVSAAAPNVWVLMVGRIVQAAGGGALVPVTIAVGASLFEGRRALVAIGGVAAAAEAGGVLGPLWGAAITEWLDWRWIFWLNAPVCALIAPAVWRLPLPRPPVAGSIDWPALGSVAAALTCLTVALSFDAETPRGLALGVLAASGALLVGFVARTLRSRDPVLDLRLFTRRTYAVANVSSVLMGAGLIVAMVNLPLFSATVLGRGALDGGLLLMRMTVWIPVAAVVGAFAAARVGPAAVGVLGFAAAALGLALMAQWNAATDEGRMTRDLAAAGAGFGLVIAPVTAGAVRAAGAAFAGIAAGVVVVARLVGMMGAVAWMTPWGLARFAERTRDLAFPTGSGAEFERAMAGYLADLTQAQEAMFHDLFLIGALFVGLAVIPALGLGRRAVPAGA